MNFRNVFLKYFLYLALACPDPGIRSGLHRNGTVELGKTVIYNCIKPGYKLVGDKNRTCVYLGEKNGTGWTGSIPICEGEILFIVDLRSLILFLTISCLHLAFFHFL